MPRRLPRGPVEGQRNAAKPRQSGRYGRSRQHPLVPSPIHYLPQLLASSSPHRKCARSRASENGSSGGDRPPKTSAILRSVLTGHLSTAQTTPPRPLRPRPRMHTYLPGTTSRASQHTRRQWHFDMTARVLLQYRRPVGSALRPAVHRGRPTGRRPSTAAREKFRPGLVKIITSLQWVLLPP